MTPSARLQAVLDLLLEIETTPRPADALVSGYFRARRYIGSHDRAAVSAMLYDILRHHARLGWWIEHACSGISPSPPGGKGWDGGFSQQAPNSGISGSNPHLTSPRGGTLPMQCPRPALSPISSSSSRNRCAISRACSTARIFAGAASAMTKKLAAQAGSHTHRTSRICRRKCKAECPPWAAASLKNRFGKNFMREMLALLDPAPLDLRVNPLKATREEMLDELKKARRQSRALPAFTLRHSHCRAAKSHRVADAEKRLGGNSG